MGAENCSAPQRRVLAVDDDRQILELLEVILGEDHRVRTTTSGEEALRLLAEAPYDLVVLDLGMPDMAGDEVKREMDARGHRTPVLLLSGESDLRARAVQLCASDFLAKPFSPAELSARAARLLGA